MKKMISVLLALMMLFAIVPVYAQSGGQEAENAIESVQVEELKKERPTVREITEEMRPYEEETAELFEAGESELMENMVTLSGYINLPSWTTEAGRMGIYLYEIKKDGNRVEYVSNNSKASITVDVGAYQNSVYYSLNAPAGTYVVGVRYFGRSYDILNEYQYYCGNTTTSIKAAATEVELLYYYNTVNINLLPAETYISGTITLEEPATYNGYGYVYAYQEDGQSNYYISFPVNAGDTYFNYYIGVRKGVYSVDFDVNGQWGYYSIYGTLADWDDICYVSTCEGSVTDLNVVIGEGEEDYSDNRLTVTIMLPEVTQEKREFVLAMDGEDGGSSYSFSIPQGVNVYEKIVYPDRGDFILALSDITGIYENYWDMNAWYYSDTLGFTGDRSKATVMDPNVCDSIVFDLTNSSYITGVVNRNGSNTSLKNDLFVVAEIESERFIAPATINKGENSANYKILIPNRYLYSNKTVYSVIRGINSGILTNLKGDKVTTNSNTGIVVNEPAGEYFLTGTGTITLSEPAPACGVVLNFRSRVYDIEDDYSRSVTTATYIIPGGETTLNYEMLLYNDPEVWDDGELRASVSISSSDEKFNMNSSKSIYFDEENLVQNCYITALDQTITGKIQIPYGIELSSGATFEMSCEYESEENSGYSYTYVSILPGKSEVSYKIKVPSNANLTYLCLYPENMGSLPISENELYYDGTGTTTDWADIYIPLQYGLSNVNFVLQKGKVITGTISLDEYGFIESGELEGRISIESVDGYFYNSDYFEMNSSGEVTYALSIPEDYDEFELYVYFYDESQCSSNIVKGEYYYAGGNVLSTEYNDREPYYAYDETNVLNVVIPSGIMLNCNLKKDYNAIGEVLGATVALKSVQDYSDYYASIGSDGCVSVAIPKTPCEYYISVYPEMSNVTNIIEKEYYYVDEYTSSDSAKGAKVIFTNGTETSLNLSFVLETGNMISGKVVLPEGVSLDTSAYNSVGIYAYDGVEFEKYIDLTGKETAFGIGIEKDDENDEICAISYDYEGENSDIYIGGLYYSENGPVTDYEEASSIDLSNGSVSDITLQLVGFKKKISLTAKRLSNDTDMRSLYPDIYIEFDDGSEMYTGVGIYSDETSGKGEFGIPDIGEAESFKLNYSIYRSGNTLKYVYDDLYVNSDGTYTFDEEKATEYSIAETENIEFYIQDSTYVANVAVSDGYLKITIEDFYNYGDESYVYVDTEEIEDRYIRYIDLMAVVVEYNSEDEIVSVRRSTEQTSISAGNSWSIAVPGNYEEGNKYKIMVWDRLGRMIPMAEYLITE